MIENTLSTFLSLRAGHPVTLIGICSASLSGSGGYVARSVERLDVTYTDADSPDGAASFVRKYTHPAEIAVMRLLRPLAETHALLFLIVDGQDTTGPWMIISFIDGQRLDGQWDLPPDVVSTFVHVHTAFTRRIDELHFLPRLDGPFWQGLLDHLEKSLGRASWTTDNDARGVIQRGIGVLRNAQQVPSALTALPAALLHGDVHGGKWCHDRGLSPCAFSCV